MREVLDGKRFVWHHIVSLQTEDLDFLRAQFQFHHLDFDDVQSDNPIPKFNVYKYYAFGVFHIPRWNGENHIVTDDLEVFLGPDYLVTVARRPIDVLERLYLRTKQNPKLRADLLGKTPSYTLYRILRILFQHTQNIASDLVHRVGEVEQTVWDVRDRTTTRALAQIRRNVLFLRSSIDPQRSILAQLSHPSERAYLSEDSSRYFQDVLDTLNTIWTVSENVKQSVDGLFEVNATLISERTSDVITIFTIMTAALMPPTLIAGFYGMNVSWLPFVTHPLTIFALFFLSITAFFLILFSLSRRKS